MAGAQRLWQPPQLHAAHDHEEEETRRVTWLELFFDLMLVATIVQLGEVLSDNVSLLGALEFAALFVPIWWAWSGVTFYNNRFEVDDIWQRLLVFVQMFALGNMAITVPSVFEATSMQFAMSYVVVRVVLVIQYVRAGRAAPVAQPLTRRYSIGFGIAAAIWLVSVFVPPPLRYGLWAIATIIDLGTPLLPSSRRIASRVPPDLPHLTERFGLFTLIVLGESFLKVITHLAGTPITLSMQLIGAATFAITGCIWWTYFDDVAGSQIRRITRWGPGPAYYLYTHLPVSLGIVAVGVGSTKFIDLQMMEPVADRYRWLLCGALAITLTAVAIIDQITDREDTATDNAGRALARIVAAAALLVVALLGGALPALPLATLIAAICIAQVVFDLVMEARAGEIAGDRERSIAGARTSLENEA